MKNHGTVQSTIEPKETEITETKVFIASEVTPISEPDTDEQPGFKGYSYNLVEYDKDEYIQMIQERNTALEDETTAIQMALCDVYEMLA